MDNQLLQLNKRGIFPKEGEETEQFLERAEGYLCFSKKLINALDGPLSSFQLSSSQQLLPASLESHLKKTEELFDVRPDWVPVFRSQNLSSWIGGMTTLISLDGSDPFPFIEVKGQLEAQKKYLWSYTAEEIISHELLHAARLAFPVSRFEEIICFQTSHNRFRRFFGPILSESWEAYLFMGSLLLGGFGGVFLQVAGSAPLLTTSLINSIQASPVILLGAGLARLIARQHSWQKSLKRLEGYFQDARQARVLLFRLNDSEIHRIAKSSAAHLPKTLKDLNDGSLRWQVIQAAYG